MSYICRKKKKKRIQSFYFVYRLGHTSIRNLNNLIIILDLFTHAIGLVNQGR